MLGVREIKAGATVGYGATFVAERPMRLALLAGGYAFRAHEILHRPSQDLDFVTGDHTPLPEIAAQVQAAFQRAGYGVRLAEAASLRYAPGAPASRFR